ncbi:type II toxin-antitoxin system RelE/ParE family toxin [Aquincola tertiaricarbonis]|uniref:Type II toxin-antitoxin system RelE/ParE family toxin n=1 Tax=Aquincola tertiaricarbonis TaxID=391953 RepID=A0ABY4SDA0_AQUTE|nr:type II toxin-antitoxin system RelE/ParE family toxin [Aquincola tertiaricarbonis]URI11296.1 type II toxin-antitoxin system RelE/ParE family toxin [Aquincola tertiaricarbonis]
MPLVHLSGAARQDLIDHFAYLDEEAGQELADRFLQAAETCLNLLATQPTMGSPLRLRSAQLAGLRKWRISGFDNVLVFYLPRADGISVIRILHAAQDWWRLVGMSD